VGGGGGGGGGGGAPQGCRLCVPAMHVAELTDII